MKITVNETAQTTGAPVGEDTVMGHLTDGIILPWTAAKTADAVEYIHPRTAFWGMVAYLSGGLVAGGIWTRRRVAAGEEPFLKFIL